MILLAASITTAVLLVAEHIILWRKPWHLGRIPAFILGTFTIGLGVSMWALWTGNTDAAEAYWCITIVGGGAVVVAYWIRGRLAELDARAFAAGQVAGPGEDDAANDVQRGTGGA